MKTEIQIIPPKEEERAVLFLHKEDRETKELLGYLELERFRQTFLVCRKEKDICRIRTAQICYIESAQEIQYIHTEGSVYTTKQRLYALEEMLPRFLVRISRSVLLNMEKVKEYHPLMGGLMSADLTNGETVYISRKYVKELRKKIREEE